jgi:hypothetical protein
MRKRFATAVLAAALLGIGSLQPGHAAEPAVANAVAAPDKAGEHAAIPVKQVVLYSSGVGYFEHYGTVKGSGTTELRFKTQQINDILKSLVLQDMDKGRVGVITYPSQDPIAKTLRSFQIDITANPSLADLLNQLRGAKVTISAGPEKVSGTVLGVERKQRPVGSGQGAQVVEIPFLNIIADDGAIRSISLEDIRNLQLQDRKLQDELNRALAALAGARDQDKKPVLISLQGEGERRVRIGYVVETPVWKTSYRLVLSDKPGDPKAAPNLGGGGPAVGDAKPAQPAVGGPAVGGAAAGAKGSSGALQGWAIVENQTDNDWNDVQLSLVSGRPISFIQDLYQPLYVPRPVVQPELYASLRPQTYDAGLAEGRPMAPFERTPVAAATPPPAPPGAGAPAASFARQNLSRAAGAAKEMKKLDDRLDSESLAAIDVTSSVSSIASATKMGELFQYTVGSVSLPRQTSAMIPVVTDAVEVEKLSIYNVSVLPKNPLLGARVKNTTGKHLLQGPVTVLDGGAYAGDARIDDLPPGQERLVSYGVDQQVIVQAKNNKHETTVQTGKIVKGVLHLTRKQVLTQDYIAENKGDRDRTLIVEHARRSGWKLAAPAKADETTDTLYRFKGAVAAGKGTQLTVSEELVNVERISILNMDDSTTAVYVRTGAIPQNVRDALAKAAQLRQDVAGTQRQIQDWQQKVSVISQEQNRIRDNMKTVAQNTDYYARLLKKLDEQESMIEALQKEIFGLQKEEGIQRKALQDYINGLNIG